MIRIIFLIVLTNLVASTRAHDQQLTYMGLGGNQDEYHDELLRAITKQHALKNYHVSRYQKDIHHHRAFYHLSNKNEMDIVIAYATKQREEKYTSIPIPILKGLSGWRLAVVHKDNANLLSNTNQLQQLRTFKAGQNPTWTDARILTLNGISVSGSTNFDSLFLMLDHKRFDYLPRPVLVIDSEVDFYNKNKQADIIVDPHLLITYPTALYFYVAKDRPQLAKDLHDGFENILKNGEFDRLFNKYHGDIITRIRSQNRKVIKLDNPLLPESVNLDRQMLWLNLAQ